MPWPLAFGNSIKYFCIFVVVENYDNIRYLTNPMVCEFTGTGNSVALNIIRWLLCGHISNVCTVCAAGSFAGSTILLDLCVFDIGG